MSKSLVIVESPAKAKTIKKYLGKDFEVEASSGHLIDLPASKFGVDIEKGFQPHYVVIRGKKKFLDKLAKAVKKVDKVYLASDPDREGEAIAWHIVNKLNIKDKSYRVLINEITKEAVLNSIKNPTTLSKEKFEAQQTRRILDRIVGYKVSPVLWKKIRKGLSAGRVQSVALRLIVEREREIELFEPREYWTIDSLFRKLQENGSLSEFTATLNRYEGEKVNISTEEEALRIVSSLEGQSAFVKDVKRKERRKKPLPPFITSTLQREASKKLGFSVKKTMMIAQRLYEGIELGEEGPVGLITYMRTDSVRVSETAISDVRGYITTRFGEQYLPSKPNIFKTKKTAQDAHEAIRPTSVHRTPESIKEFLSKDEFRLYELIWKRFISSQMSPAVYDQTTVDIEVGKAVFRATGSVIKFPGFTAVYVESPEEEEEMESKEETKKLPDLEKGDSLELVKIEPKQHFTQPPPRYTESSLVKELEEKGIGRPSTYASILSTIQERDYVRKEKKKLIPTLLGMAVNDMLVEGFPEIVNVKFTADMEEKLDKIEEGGIHWVKLLEEFYSKFSKQLENAEETLKSLKKDGIPTDIACDKCGASMIVKWGRGGEFLSCSRYPECKNAKSFEYDEEGNIRVKEKSSQVLSDIVCDKCGKPMVLRRSRYGEFYGCSGYPECKNIKSIAKKSEASSS